MLYMRCKHYSELQRDVSVVRYLAWDSSPQFRRGFEMSLVKAIKKQHLPAMMAAFYRLATRWILFAEEPNLEPPEMQARIAADQRDIDFIRHRIQCHTLPAVLVGFGRSGFPYKLHTLLHACRLEHFTHASLAHWLSQISTVMSDYGVEHQWMNARPISLNEFCCFFEDTTRKSIDILMEGFTPQNSKSHGKQIE